MRAARAAMRRALWIPLALAILAAPAAAAGSSTGLLLGRAGEELLRDHVSGPRGGWAWRSAIQRPHLQTDRDVGAAGIAVALLAIWERTGQGRYLTAARRAGDWLLTVAQRSGPGLRWPDFHDPGRVSDTHFTSFDDGTAGVADLLWRLGVATGDRRYRDAAVAGMRWVAAQARGADGLPCPRECRWRYYDKADDYRTGMGEGIAGIAYALDRFAHRTGDRRFEAEAVGAAAYLERLMGRSGAVPEVPGTTGDDTGFLSGSAGDAFLFLDLYRSTRDRRWLGDARRLLAWVRAEGRPQPGGGLAWPIEVDPRKGNDPLMATGIEEGAAGIGWVELQAYAVTRDRADLRVAERAGIWLVHIARGRVGRASWPEDAGGRLVHTGLNNGAPGIAWFLEDLARATGRRSYGRTAQAAVRWLAATARPDGAAAFWFENMRLGKADLPHEPSWHWGTAGIVAFLARMAGGPLDAPGEEPALSGGGILAADPFTPAGSPRATWVAA